MTEVDKYNFAELLDTIEYNIKKCTFFAIDCEFSGLRSNSTYDHSLFDSARDRYLSLKANTTGIIILQFGLSVYTFNRDLNQYNVDCYKFYVVPRPFGSEDSQFLCQASSLEFLCRHKFDINKVVYDGISFLDSESEQKFRKLAKDGNLYYHIYSHLETDELDEIRNILESIFSWIKSASENDIQTFTPTFSSKLFFHILKDEIKKKFPNVWVTSEGNFIKVKVVSTNDRISLEENDKDSLDKLIDSYVGFSNVFKILAESKKPLIGHNLLMDLLIMYRQFYKPLPRSLDLFKKSVHELFPRVYDTKLISYDLQRSINPECRTGGTSLSAMYEYLVNKGNHLSSFSPAINLRCSSFDQVQDQQIHDAGWDSFMTGVIFIKMSHYFASKNEFSGIRQLASVERFSAVNHLVNKINLARAADSIVYLEGDEGVRSQRPPLLYVSSKKKKLDLNLLNGLLTKYGNYDVKRLDSHSALLAVMNFASAREIISDFNKNKEWRVVRYNILKHSPTLRKFMWAGLAIPLSITAFYYGFFLKKKS